MCSHRWHKVYGRPGKKGINFYNNKINLKNKYNFYLCLNGIEKLEGIKTLKFGIFDCSQWEWVEVKQIGVGSHGGWQQVTGQFQRENCVIGNKMVAGNSQQILMVYLVLIDGNCENQPLRNAGKGLKINKLL